MSETLSNESYAELENELEELMKENDDETLPAANSEVSGPEFENLEQRLKNLHMDGKNIFKRNFIFLLRLYYMCVQTDQRSIVYTGLVSPNTNVSSRKDKPLKKLECL